jgi:hypothetical protein
MNKRGVTTAELLMWLGGGAIAVLGYIHVTFATYREVVPRLDRIENLIIEMKKGK